MKKKIIFSTLITLTASILLVTGGVARNNTQTNAEAVNDVTELNSLLDRFYNNGYYVKDTEIFLTDDAANELSQHSGFHQSTELVRTTYYTPEALWMSRAKEAPGVKYSYYGTDEYGNLTNATADNALVTPENPKVALKKGSNTSTGTWHDDVGGMEGYYITLKDINPTGEQVWNYADGIYSSGNPEVIEWFKAFCAPCYVGSGAEEVKNYVVLSGVEIQQVGTNLELRLYSTGDKGKLSSGSDLFAKASVKYFSVDNVYVKLIENKAIYTITGESYGLSESDFDIKITGLHNYQTLNISESVSISNNIFTLTSDVTDILDTDVNYISHFYVDSVKYDLVNIGSINDTIISRDMETYNVKYALLNQRIWENQTHLCLYKTSPYITVDGKELYFPDSNRILHFENVKKGPEKLTLFVTQIENKDLPDEKGLGYYVFYNGNGIKSIHKFQYSMDSGYNSWFESQYVNGGTLVEQFNTDGSQNLIATVNGIDFRVEKLDWHWAILGWDY